MYKNIVIFIVFITLISSVVGEPEDVSMLANGAEDLKIEPLEPLIEFIQPLLAKMSVVVGGIFGLYLILILVRVYYEKRKVELLKGIQFNLDQLNKKYNLKTHKERINLKRKLWNYLTKRK